MNEIHFCPGIPLNFVERDLLGICCIKKLAIDISGTELLYFGKRKQKDIIKPIYDVKSGCGRAFRS